jgi:hypothetical protein
MSTPSAFWDFCPPSVPQLLEMMSGVLRLFRQSKRRGGVRVVCSELYIVLQMRFIY